MLAEAGTGGGSAFERDAAVVLRRDRGGVRDAAGAADRDNRRAYLDLLGRVIRRAPSRDAPASRPRADAPDAALDSPVAGSYTWRFVGRLRASASAISVEAATEPQRKREHHGQEL